MVNFLENPEQFKAELKDKFLDYYQANQIWLEKMEGRGQTINNSWFILGVITALEPKSELKELLQYFLAVSKHSDSIIQALGLDFNLEKELQKRKTELAAKEKQNTTEYLDKIREEIKT